jgi:hypothetical protein
MRLLCLGIPLLAGLLGACAAPAEDGDPDGDQSDDLTSKWYGDIKAGRRVEVAFPSQHVVRPTIDEGPSRIVVGSDDLRITNPTGKFEIKLAQDDPGKTGSAYGLVIQRENAQAGVEPWTMLPPRTDVRLESGLFDGSYLWETITVEVIANSEHGFPQLILTGEAVAYKDRSLGLSAGVDRRKVTQPTISDEGDRQTTVRVFVVPAWDFWDWDETGYEARVSFRAL